MNIKEYKNKLDISNKELLEYVEELTEFTNYCLQISKRNKNYLQILNKSNTDLNIENKEKQALDVYQNKYKTSNLNRNATTNYNVMLLYINKNYSLSKNVYKRINNIEELYNAIELMYKTNIECIYNYFCFYNEIYYSFKYYKALAYLEEEHTLFKNERITLTPSVLNCYIQEDFRNAGLNYDEFRKTYINIFHNDYIYNKQLVNYLLNYVNKNNFLINEEFKETIKKYAMQDEFYFHIMYLRYRKQSSEVRKKQTIKEYVDANYKQGYEFIDILKDYFKRKSSSAEVYLDSNLNKLVKCIKQTMQEQEKMDEDSLFTNNKDFLNYVQQLIIDSTNKMKQYNTSIKFNLKDYKTLCYMLKFVDYKNNYLRINTFIIFNKLINLNYKELTFKANISFCENTKKYSKKNNECYYYLLTLLNIVKSNSTKYQIPKNKLISKSQINRIAKEIRKDFINEIEP